MLRRSQFDVKGHTESSTQTEEEGKEGSKVHNAIHCNIDFDDEHDNEIALGDVAVISNLKKGVDLNGTFGLVTVRWTSSRRGNCGEELGRFTAKELGGNLRYVLSNIEYAEVCAVLAFLSRHLEFAGGAEDENDSEGSSPRNRPWERRPPDPRTTLRKRRKVKSLEEDL